MTYCLRDLGLVDALPQPAFDNLTKLATEIIGAPVSLVSIVDFENDRQFFKSQIGLSEPWATKQQTPLSHSFCRHVVQNNSMLVVENAPEHPLVRDNLAIRDLGVIAYLGVPVYTPVNQPTGALCVIQGEPRKWTKQEIQLLEQLACCVSDAIRLNGSLLDSERLRKEQHEFTYAISHDLKSPANTLAMVLDELRSEVASEDGQELLDAGLATTARMAQQVEDILDYTRTIGDKEPHELVDMNQMIDEITHDLAGEIGSVNATVQREDLPKVFGSRFQLKSMFQNLVGNSIKYSKRDIEPVVIISAGVDLLGRFDALEIKDNGIGIAPENHAKVFKMFARLHVREDYAGTGMGLALCARVCANHQGTIDVASELGEGTVITVKLPRRQT